MTDQILTQKLSVTQDSLSQEPLNEMGLQPSPNSRIKASRWIWKYKLARKEQLPPEGDWNIWLAMAGRGFGKTRLGAEEIAWQAIIQPATRWAVVAPTFADARDTCAEGESGIVAILQRYKMLDNYNRSLGEILLKNGSKIKLFSADNPERFRGPQHHGAWCDELGAWRYQDAWDQLQFGLRLGKNRESLLQPHRDLRP
jgi:phage terminase large subunit-like protein